MALLAKRHAILVGIVACAGCYDPSLRDCLVACASESDCGPGQVCSATGVCASPDVACTASGEPVRPPDAGTRPRDAAVVDAGPPPIDAPPDAPTLHRLTVKVTGSGRVEIAGVGTCRDECGYDVSGPLSLRAFADDEARLDKWQDACAGTSGDTCVLVVIAPARAGVKFTDDD